MTALTAIQREWIKNSEDGLITGILIWDLSAAFDTVDTELLCLKLGLYLLQLLLSLINKHIKIMLNWFYQDVACNEHHTQMFTM